MKAQKKANVPEETSLSEHRMKNVHNAGVYPEWKVKEAVKRLKATAQPIQDGNKVIGYVISKKSLDEIFGDKLK